eukprot:c28061_g2_i1 orf=87-1958(+)
MAVRSEELQKRPRFLPRKSDFFPEESFQSWRSYGNALSELPWRFTNRVFARSSAHLEIHDIRKRSMHEMKKTLRWWDLMWFGIGVVIGAGIFVLTGQEAHEHAGPGIILAYVAAGVSGMLSVSCYTEFAVEIPVAGGSFAYLRVELGDFMAFIAAGNIVLEYMIGGAVVARSWTSYFATLLNHHPDDFRIHVNLIKDFSLLDPVAVAILIITGTVAVLSTRVASVTNSVATIVQLLIISFVIIAGIISAMVRAETPNLRPFLPYGVRGIFKAASVVFFAYVGFDAVCTMAEETMNPGKDIPIGLIGSMSIITLLYCLMALTLSLMQKYSDLDTNAPFPVAFKNLGLGWAQYIVALGALKGMTSSLLVGSVAQARYLTHIARTHLIPPWFALVNERTGTPIHATVIMVLATSVIAFFADLAILSNLLSISTLFIFMLVALALLVRRYYIQGETSASRLRLLASFLLVIIVSSTATAIYWASGEQGWIIYTVTIALWFLGTLGLASFIPQARKPRVWACPLVPWLPSLSIACNIFLLGSIDKYSFIRFGVWTGLMLLYYFLFGLHASYDTATATAIPNEEGLQSEQLLVKAAAEVELDVPAIAIPSEETFQGERLVSPAEVDPIS